MRLLKVFFLFVMGFLWCFTARTQNDSCHLKVSLLTCGPGEDLYSLFGHSGLRVIDRITHTDVVYNYGTIEFDEDFYVNFVKGKMNYSVSEQPFDSFMYEYQVENRSVIQQDLQLTCGEKEQLYGALQTNALPQNKYYLYQFLFDNCSTRLRDMVEANASDSVHFKNILGKSPPSFRDMLHEYLDNGKQYWSEFGIDLLLASRIDRKVKNTEAMFLPDYLMKGFDSAVLRNAPLVGVKRTILPRATYAENKNGFSVTPFMATMALLVLGILLTIFRSGRWQRVGNIFDMVYFFLLGCLGCFMLFMWLGTDHELCRDNYNLLWALPTHIVMAFFVRSKKTGVSFYFLTTAIICLILLISWAFFPQYLHPAFFPLILLAGIRSRIRAYKK